MFFFTSLDYNPCSLGREEFMNHARFSQRFVKGRERILSTTRKYKFRMYPVLSCHIVFRHRVRSRWGCVAVPLECRRQVPGTQRQGSNLHLRASVHAPARQEVSEGVVSLSWFMLCEKVLFPSRSILEVEAALIARPSALIRVALSGTCYQRCL